MKEDEGSSPSWVKRLFNFIYAWIAQTVEQLAVNQRAVGSSPTPGANDVIIMKQSIRILRGEIGILKRLIIFRSRELAGSSPAGPLHNGLVRRINILIT